MRVSSDVKVLNSGNINDLYFVLRILLLTNKILAKISDSIINRLIIKKMLMFVFSIIDAGFF